MWFFRSPSVIYGSDALQMLQSIGVRRPVIVTDKNVRAAGLIDLVTANLDAVDTLIIDSIPEEPSIEDIATEVSRVKEFGPDWIISVGGGSSMDAAKLLFFKTARPDLDYFDLTPLTPLGLKKGLGLIAIPTTSGTGSECTWAAVITDSNDKRKAELASPEIIPDYAILDPAMVQKLPPEVTRNTATDALTHAIEAYVSSWKNPYSDALALEAVSLITSGISGVLKDPDDLDSRSSVHIGASMAGSAFSNSQIGLAHAMGHAFGSVFRKPHGASVGIFLPGVIKFNSVASDGLFDELNSRFSPEFRCANLYESVTKFLVALGRATTVSGMGISPEEFLQNYEKIADLSFESTGIVGNPRDVRKQDILDILDSVKE